MPCNLVAVVNGKIALDLVEDLRAFGGKAVADAIARKLVLKEHSAQTRSGFVVVVYSPTMAVYVENSGKVSVVLYTGRGNSREANREVYDAVNDVLRGAAMLGRQKRVAAVLQRSAKRPARTSLAPSGDLVLEMEV